MAIEQWLWERYPDLIADTVAVTNNTIPEEWYADRTEIVRPLDRALRKAGLLERYADFLSALRAWCGENGPPIVPSPPYVVVTGRGPMLRLTLSDSRVIILFELFVLDEDRRAYRATHDCDDPLTITVT